MRLDLGGVRRPSQYVGREWNLARPPARPALRAVLAFPDLYEIGMSNSGLQVLYAVLAGLPEVAVERAFCPWPDMEAALAAHGVRLGSLETGRPLAEFDLVGISLQHELAATNVLTLLASGGIPLAAADRGESHPIVLGGGPCVANPEPLAPFFDAFVQGDGEEALAEVAGVLARTAGRPRHEKLAALAGLDGLYVPLLHPIGPDGRLESAGAGGRVAIGRRRVADLDRAPWPERPLAPLVRIVHDRVAVEVSRGCRHRCRFCQAGATLQPLRHRSPETVERLALAGLAATGYDQLSLNALSVGDYPDLEGLVGRLMAGLAPRRVSLSIPSVRPGALTPELIHQIRRVRKTGFTLAPEAGSAELRWAMGKRIADEELIRSAWQVFGAGWDLVKLYFMVGFPGETDSDVDAIARMCLEVLAAGARAGARGARLNVSLSPFVPKPQTPLQWAARQPPDELADRLGRIRGRLARVRAVALKVPPLPASHLEAVLARGGRELAAVIEAAWRGGARFDDWGECFRWPVWLAAFESAGIDPLAAAAARPLDRPLAWDHMLDERQSALLRAEYDRALARDGAAPAEAGPPADARQPPAGYRADPEPPRAGGPAAPGHRVRLAYRRTGALAWLSHLDVVKAIGMALRRSRLPVAYSQGYSPHPKIAFGPPLPVGIESEAELMEIELSEPQPAAAVLEALAAELPPEMAPGAAVELPAGARSLGKELAAMEVVLVPGSPARAAAARARLEDALAGLDPESRPAILDMETPPDGRIRFLLDLRAARPVKLEPLRQALGFEAAAGDRFYRAAMYSDREGRAEIAPGPDPGKGERPWRARS